MSDPIADAATTLIQRHEGCRLAAYPDPLTGGDPWTIGWGHTGPGIGEGVTWTQGECDAAFAAALGRIIGGLDARLPWWRTLTPARAAVLADMAYNMGIEGLLGFHHTLWLIRTGAYDAAASAMLDSDWADQVGERATEDAQIMRTGALS